MQNHNEPWRFYSINLTQLSCFRLFVPSSYSYLAENLSIISVRAQLFQLSWRFVTILVPFPLKS